MQYIAMIEAIADAPQYQFLWHELPVEERLKEAARAGFAGVDFWDWIDKDIDHLAQVAADHGIFINSVFGSRRGSLSNAADHDRVLDQFRESLEMAARCGIRALFVQSDEVGPGGQVVPPARPLSVAERWQALEEGLWRLVELVDSSGLEVTLLIEPLSKLHVHGYLLRSVLDAARLVQRLNSPRLRLVFDLFHQQINEGNLINNLRATIDLVGAIHIADVPERGAPGTGEINIARIYREMLALGYDGQIGFECVPGHRSTAEVLAAIRAIFPFPDPDSDAERR
ncbi:hydroxypyruvate isomerase [Thermogemmatispora aurantia]|uniref:TIM barrel protein n=1 Tax=Thermogemmatispora aurantia TaxID=2045279 RepID=UPI00124D7A01|nr:TIM barrel protein [Thermogemmatispora aurantia]GER85435.1 hydroxypyruvate isomerase [Thermogemmatispora aurantia]